MKVSIKQLSAVIFSVIIVLLSFVFIKYSLLLPLGYKNNLSLDKTVNQEIKQLTLNAVKSRHTSLFTVDNEQVFSPEYLAEHESEDDSFLSKSPFIIPNTDFMETVKEISKDEYAVEVQLISPVDWKYFLTIKNINGMFYVSQIEIDP